MAWDSIYVVNDRLATASTEEVKELEDRLHVRVPAGYSEFAHRFGEGVFCGFLRIYMPRKILDEHGGFRRKWREDPFWNEGPLIAEDLARAVILGDSLQGDQLVLHSSRPGTVFVLPHNSETSWEAGDDLEQALNWICSSGELVAPISSRYFESNLDRVRHRFDGPEAGKGVLAMLKRPPGYAAVRKALLGLGVHNSVDESHPEDGEACIQLFVREFEGSVTLIEADRLIALVCRSEDKLSPAFERVVSTLTGLGFRQAD
ncbi:MAG: SMI1/KNR4 family protein [Armatimonadetes bacterium]|nr:SMI1/KNR4 family protein [Armatimonadota bacterium]